MDAEALKELFEPFAAVSVRRMFSGYGVYADGLCFALNLRGGVFLKADGLTEARFIAAGSEPFVYEGRRGAVTVMSYWRLLPSAYDDPDELKMWCGLAFEAARRGAAIKADKAARRIAKAGAPPPEIGKQKGKRRLAANPTRAGRGHAKGGTR
ncbi:MAG TPA: TfoX/Sxy family protein [Roseiarcus sp.]|nr:TfoX/Sxy family protein [Roseiarcus sp.]